MLLSTSAPFCRPLAAYAAFMRGGAIQGSMEVVVQRTFLTVPCRLETGLPRSSSAPPPPGACDHEAETLQALTYKLQPVCAEKETAPSESTVVPDGDSEAASESVPFEAHGSSFSSATSSQEMATRSLSQQVAAGDTWATDMPVKALVDGGVPNNESLVDWAPLDHRGIPTSIGSIAHAQGVCKPCLFAYHAAKVCKNGIACPFCHFEHAPKRRTKAYRKRRA